MSNQSKSNSTARYKTRSDRNREMPRQCRSTGVTASGPISTEPSSPKRDQARGKFEKEILARVEYLEKKVVEQDAAMRLRAEDDKKKTYDSSEPVSTNPGEISSLSTLSELSAPFWKCLKQVEDDGVSAGPPKEASDASSDASVKLPMDTIEPQEPLSTDKKDDPSSGQSSADAKTLDSPNKESTGEVAPAPSTTKIRIILDYKDKRQRKIDEVVQGMRNGKTCWWTHKVPMSPEEEQELHKQLPVSVHLQTMSNDDSGFIRRIYVSMTMPNGSEYNYKTKLTDEVKEWNGRRVWNKNPNCTAFSNRDFRRKAKRRLVCTCNPRCQDRGFEAFRTCVEERAAETAMACWKNRSGADRAETDNYESEIEDFKAYGYSLSELEELF